MRCFILGVKTMRIIQRILSSTDHGSCRSGTSVGTFIFDTPNRTSILLVSQPFIIKWHYTPPVKNPPKSLGMHYLLTPDIKLQLVQDGVSYTWSTIVVKNLNISNGATAFNWTVQPLNGK